MLVRYKDSYLCNLFDTKKLLHSYVRNIAYAVTKCGKLGDVINCSGSHIFIKCSSDEDTHAYIRELKGKFIAEYIVSNSIAYGVSLRCDTITLPVMIMKVDRLWRTSTDVHVRFKVSTLDEFHELVIVDFGLDFDKEVLK